MLFLFKNVIACIALAFLDSNLGVLLRLREHRPLFRDFTLSAFCVSISRHAFISRPRRLRRPAANRRMRVDAAREGMTLQLER